MFKVEGKIKEPTRMYRRNIIQSKVPTNAGLPRAQDWVVARAQGWGPKLQGSRRVKKEKDQRKNPSKTRSTRVLSARMEPKLWGEKGKNFTNLKKDQVRKSKPIGRVWGTNNRRGENGGGEGRKVLKEKSNRGGGKLWDVKVVCQ